MPTCPYHSLHARPRHAHRTMHARAVYSSFHAHSGRQILLVWPLGWHQFWPTSFFWGGPFNDREGSGGSAMCCYLCVIVETSFRVSCHVHYHVYVTLWTIVCSFFLFNLLSSLCGVRKLWTVSIRPMYLSIKQPVNTFPLVTIVSGLGSGEGGRMCTRTQISCKSILAPPLGSLAQVGIPGAGQGDLTGVKYSIRREVQICTVMSLPVFSF